MIREVTERVQEGEAEGDFRDMTLMSHALRSMTRARSKTEIWNELLADVLELRSGRKNVFVAGFFASWFSFRGFFIIYSRIF